MGMSAVRSSSVAFLSFQFPRSHWQFHFSACLFFVSCRPSSSSPNFKPHSSHTGPPTAPQLPTPAAVSPIIPPPPSVPISSLVFEGGFTVGFQPSRVTGLPASSPKTKSAALDCSFLFSRSSPGHNFFFSAQESRYRSPLRGRIC